MIVEVVELEAAVENESYFEIGLTTLSLTAWKIELKESLMPSNNPFDCISSICLLPFFPEVYGMTAFLFFKYDGDSPKS